MKLSAAVAIAILAATQAFAQGPAPVTSPAGLPLSQSRPFTGRRGMSSGNQNPSATPSAALHQRIEDMQATLNSMHALMKQMRDKATKSGTKDPLVKANLGMWELMVGHLDKQLAELKLAAVAREDMEARRAALYKQADAKAEAEARAARAAQAAKFGVEAPVSGGQGAVPSPAGQTAPAQAPAAQTPSAPASPATSTASPN